MNLLRRINHRFLRNLGLSLTDHYWIKPIDSGLTWKDVNLYENDFKDKIAELNFCNTITDLDEATSFYPGSSLQGELENGLDSGYIRSFLEYQILIDFIITNTDRHSNNFGVLRNSENLKFFDAAPIFDSGNSMFWNNPKMPLYNDLTNIKISGFRGIEKDMLGYITSYENADLNLLPSNTEIEKILQYVNMAEEDISAIVLGYNKKVEMLSKYKQEV